MKRLSIILAFVAGLFALPAQAANFTAKDASAATIIFTNPGNCTTGCTPIFAWADSTGANLVAVLTAGADAASNTANGGIVYNRNMVFNGTSWDRWQGNIKAASGSFVDGWDLTQGAIADAVVSAGATGSVSAKLRRLTTDLDAAKTSLASIDTKASQALPAQSGIGNVNIGAVQSAGSAYETVAASQTAQALGATGATGDYLSHCVIYPTSTSPGVVTVFDNTNAAGTNVIAFAGGASSTSNLTPISVPVGAISVSGAWKVTTGAAVSVTCYGKFT